MSDPESTGQATPAVDSAEATPATTPEITVDTPEAGTDPAKDGESQAAKTFTQAELDVIVQKEKAKAEAKADRRALKAYRETLDRVLPQSQVQQPVDTRPSRDQYASQEGYEDALMDWRLDQRDKTANQEKAAAQSTALNTRTEKLYAEAAKLPGFDRDAFEELPLTPVIAQTLIDSEVPAKLMAYMTSNPEEVDRIRSLSPARQAAEMGKLEIKLQSAPKTSSAPPPINAVGAKGSAAPNLESASYAEYKKLRAAQGAKWAR